MKNKIILTVLMLCALSLLSACGNTEKFSEVKPSAENPSEPGRTFDTPEQEAIVLVAEAYYARRVYLQYDDTRLVTGNAVKPVIYRWELSKNSPEDATSQTAMLSTAVPGECGACTLWRGI